MESIYEKFPLPRFSRSIRLLVPEFKPEQTQMVYRFIVVSLAKSPRYAALSYVWGKPDQSEKILLEEYHHDVTVNLLDCLHKIRNFWEQQQKQGSEVLPLWADQVCINQENLPERGEQVSMMADIYSSAERVYVCLGNSRTAGDACHILSYLDEHISCQVARYGSICDIPTLSADEINTHSFLRWNEIREMLSCPWFSRAWVVQEIGLARAATVLYGDCNFEWIMLMRVLEWFCWPAFRLYNIHRLSGWTAYAIWVSFDSRSRQSANKLEPFPFLDLLSHAACRYKATDPRDHIFAFLGHPSAIGDDSQPALIRPDYTSSFQHIYTEFAKNWLERSGQPYLLSCINHKELPGDDEVKMPSWCPRWNYLPLGGSRLNSERYKGNQHYAVSKSSDFRFHILPKNRLMIRGFRYDTVAHAHTSLEQLPIPTDINVENPRFSISNLKTIIKLSHACCFLLERKRSFSLDLGSTPQDDIFEFISTARTGNRVNDYSKDNYLADFKDCIIEARNLCELVAEDSMASLKLALDALTDVLRRFGAGEDVAGFMNNVELVWASRRFFITNQGHFGIGPEILTEGDVCCIISGAPVPFIIRPFTSSTYQLVGECFIHKIMSGEALDQPGFEWSDIVIE